MTNLTRETFNQNINEILFKSKLIGDSWSLLKIESNSPHAEECVAYLSKTEQKCVDLADSLNEIYTFTYHVVFSESFAVPVLYLNVSKSNGSLLTHEEIYEYFNLTKSTSDPVYDLIITQQEHPLLFKPFYFVHPCHTADWMSSISQTATQEEEETGEAKKLTKGFKHLDNYTLTWLSFVFASFNITLDTKYGLKLNVLKEFVENKI